MTGSKLTKPPITSTIPSAVTTIILQICGRTKSLMSETSPWLMTLQSSYREWSYPWPMEPAKQVPNRRRTMPQQHRLARLRWTPNHEAYSEQSPVDLLQRWHLRTTPSTRWRLQLAVETKLEITKRKQQQKTYFCGTVPSFCRCSFSCFSFFFLRLFSLLRAAAARLLSSRLRSWSISSNRMDAFLLASAAWRSFAPTIMSMHWLHFFSNSCKKKGHKVMKFNYFFPLLQE